MKAHYISLALLMMLAVNSVAVPTARNDAKMTALADLPRPQDAQARGTRPRTWNKPYHGTPSAQCRRNSGIDSWPSSIQESENLAEMAHPDGDGEDRNAGSNAILPRQPQGHPADVNNNILADFHYTCPQGGAMSKIFMWGVVYLPGATNVVMVPWHSIIGFEGTNLSRNTGSWASDWSAMWCVPHDKLECWYTASGYTVGVLNRARDHISIGLITDSRVQRYGPTIHETCVEIGASRAGTLGATCIIQAVQVKVEGPRG